MQSDNYEDIINLPHHTSKKHPRMSLEARSAQFAPFSALTGYDEVIIETGRYVDSKIELDETQKLILDNKVQVLNENLQYEPEIIITYFIPDEKKNGGKYEKIVGSVTKISKCKQAIVLKNKIEINILNIINIDGKIFEMNGF